jgi:hypothetical protein
MPYLRVASNCQCPRKRVVRKQNCLVAIAVGQMQVEQSATDSRRANHVTRLGIHFPRLDPSPGLVPAIAFAVEVGLAAEKLVGYASRKGQILGALGRNL